MKQGADRLVTEPTEGPATLTGELLDRVGLTARHS
jgi:hypothetical protein